jgi:hypothetical protein
MKIFLTQGLPCGASFNKVKSLVVLLEPRSNKFETHLSLSILLTVEIQLLKVEK